MTRTPDLFIVGAPKSGTTSLYEYLKGHPDVFMSAVKEPNYFARDLAHDVSGNSLVFDRDEAQYLELFARAGNAKVVGEGSTRYMYSRDAPGLVHAASPAARIIAMVRNPVDMIQSLHAHKVAAGTEDILDFEQALGAEDDRRAGRRIPPHSNPLLATYRDRARFGEQIARWLDAFGRDHLKVVVFEDFMTAPAAQFHNTLEFLGVDPDFQPSSFSVHNPAHGTRSRYVQAVALSRPAQWLAWQALPKVIGDERSRRAIGAFSHSRLRRKRIERARMPAELRARLEKDFESDVALLSTLLGRDMSQFWFGRPLEETVPHKALAAS